MEALILVATKGGHTMLPRIGIMRALNRHVERVFNRDRKHTGTEIKRGSVMGSLKQLMQKAAK